MAGRLSSKSRLDFHENPGISRGYISLLAWKPQTPVCSLESYGIYILNCILQYPIFICLYYSTSHFSVTLRAIPISPLEAQST